MSIDHMTEAPEPAPKGESSWRESVPEFISARLDLFALEAKDAGQVAARKGVLIGLIAGCAVLAWIAIVAGLIGWISAAQESVPWYFVTLGAAFLHLLVAGLATLAVRRPSPPSFSLLKTELSKDREWLAHLNEKPKS
ncbi:phage holin family protein [Luteolibacter marinus]|uniref:phage holin family protein n=1 Tax=Luteolibacter marinus TaxID=2776705 RepID=UPI001865FBF3|nr:phage holin family protein [Luteolibacter marinus]